MKTENAPSPLSPAVTRRNWALMFVMLTLLLLAAGWWYYRAEAKRIRKDIYEEIAAVGKLKAGQIQLWRQERLNDANRMAGAPFVRKAVAELLREPGGTLQADLLERLKLEQTAGGYADALLFAHGGQVETQPNKLNRLMP